MNKQAKSSKHAMPAEQSDIAHFFDEMSVGRNKKIQSNPIVDYEQTVRSRTVLDLLSANRGEKILDIGCGNARDIVHILEKGAQVIGVDISEGMVFEAQQELAKLGFGDVLLKVGDATRLDFSDGEFDKVLCSEVIEHIPEADKALSEMWRVLKPGGLLVLSTPNPKSWYGFDRYIVWEKILRRKWNHPFDQWRSMRELVAMIERAGFKPATKAGACYVPGFLVTYFGLPRFVQRLLLKGVGGIEPIAAKILPQNGYMVCMAAIKRDI